MPGPGKKRKDKKIETAAQSDAQRLQKDGF